MKTRKIELYKDKKGGFRWRLKGGNGEVMNVSESYTRKYNAIKSAVKTHPTAALVDLTVKAKPKGKTLYLYSETSSTARTLKPKAKK